jgi:hypothetical protein
MTVLNKYGFVDTRGPKVGHCNICDSYGPLTADHVPPKGTLRFPQVDLIHIVALLGAEGPEGKRRSRRMQSGVHFRSLCSTCNSELLGARYDPALIEFSNSVSLLLKGAVAVPEVSFVNVTPGAVARSVLGHLLAVGIERRERTPLLQDAINFFLDDTLPMPAGLDIHYWVYPYRRQVAIRDAALVTTFFKTPPLGFWCLKYFPVAFMVVWNEKHRRVRLPNLKDFMLNAGMHPARVPVPLRQIPPQSWPEAPTDDGAVFYGDGAVGALPAS